MSRSFLVDNGCMERIGINQCLRRFAIIGVIAAIAILPAGCASRFASELSGGGKRYQFLEPGGRYRVVLEFSDNDRTVHPVGETWTFLGVSFLPDDDGLTLLVSPDGVQHRRIPLHWGAGAQARILDNLASHVQAVASAGAGQPPGR